MRLLSNHDLGNMSHSRCIKLTPDRPYLSIIGYAFAARTSSPYVRAYTLFILLSW
ncbi:hypothetical protein C8R48DRAFT_732018 [Suillus tomentosus]|nr:hypothetical protein C8R48DRAFT_732018 [Suillus tomentosus]